MIPYFVIESFTIGPITIYTWGFFVALGFIVGLFIALKEAKRKDVSQNEILNLAIIGSASAFIGARILFIIESWSYYSGNFFDIFKIWQGGLSYYGGFLGFIISGFIYIKIKKLDFWKFADVFAFPLPLGYAIGRVGCFLIHDHMGNLMGRPWPWGIKYFDGIRHETTLYGILFSLIIFIVLVFLCKKILFSGGIFLAMLLLYSVTRYFTDIFRAVDITQSDARFLGMTLAQYISIALFFISSVILLRKEKKFNLNNRN